MVINIIVCYCYTRERYTRKMLNETETEETIGFLTHFYHWWSFNWGKGPGLLAMAMVGPFRFCVIAPGQHSSFRRKVATVGSRWQQCAV